MACRGVHFALDERAVSDLRAQPSDDARLDFLVEEIEEQYFDEDCNWLAESDKAWDAIHRALTDGELGWNNGRFPLSHVILGGELLYAQDNYIMSLKTPSEVQQIAISLRNVSKADLRTGYFRIDSASYGASPSEDDFEYTWEWFLNIRELYDRAAAANRFVLFTVDQ